MFDPRLAELFLNGDWRSDLLRLAEEIDKATQPQVMTKEPTPTGAY